MIGDAGKIRVGEAILPKGAARITSPGAGLPSLPKSDLMGLPVSTSTNWLAFRSLTSSVINRAP